MSGAIPPIPPPFGLPQLLDSRGGSHVTNVPTFDKEDLTNWKVRFFVFLDGLEPCLLKTLEDGPFVHMSSLSTTENPLPKRQNQWSNVESHLGYKGIYEGLKAEMAVLTQRIDDLAKGKSEKGKKDKGTTRIRAFMAIAEDEPFVGKADARSGQWVNITMKKTCSKVTFEQLLSEQIPDNIVKSLGGKSRRKENNPSKEVMFTKADVSIFESVFMITFDSEDDSDIQEPLPPLPKLTGADPSGASKSLISLSNLTANMADLTLNTASKEIKKLF
ncbi:hypothetical protein Tco_1321403 [Tanacetum coccineum]